MKNQFLSGTNFFPKKLNLLFFHEDVHKGFPHNWNVRLSGQNRGDASYIRCGHWWLFISFLENEYFGSYWDTHHFLITIRSRKCESGQYLYSCSFWHAQWARKISWLVQRVETMAHLSRIIWFHIPMTQIRCYWFFKDLIAIVSWK